MIILAHAVDPSPIPAVALQRGDIRNAPVITYSFPEPSHPDFTGGAVERADGEEAWFASHNMHHLPSVAP